MTGKSFLQIGKELCIDEFDTKMRSPEYRQKVIDEDARAKRELGISGVPHFIIGSGDIAKALHGAQSTEALVEGFWEQLLARSRAGLD